MNGYENGLLVLDNDVHPVSNDNINPCVRDAEYAVRGPIVLRANELQRELRSGKVLPFKKLLYLNVGNPQSLGQKPMTFIRQVVALCDCPELLTNSKTTAEFPPDAIARAKEILAELEGGTGCYTESKGAEIFRKIIAKGIETRDGFTADPENIYLTDGASPGVHLWLKTLIRSKDDCVLTPIPQYPLYSACLTLYGGTLLPYYLQEEAGWALSVEELKMQTRQARSEGRHVRALVVINPGNPTGNVLERANMVEIIEFCHEFGVVLMADEVYQTNIYAPGKEFISFKKVLMEMGPDYDDVLLVSFNSSSKGYYGECGRRGGYFEVLNGSAALHAQLYKQLGVNLCSNVSGQVAMSVIMQPPQAGDASYPLWAKERDDIMESLKRRARIVVDNFNRLEGVSCNETQGAMYAFPRLTFPPRFLEEARQLGKAPDFVYCMRLLEATGAVTIPGSGFGQVAGTWHLRTTILPPEEDIEAVLGRIDEFHHQFCDKYRD